MDDPRYLQHRDKTIEQLNAQVKEQVALARYVMAQKRYFDLVRLLNNYTFPLEVHNEVGFLGEALGFDRDR